MVGHRDRIAVSVVARSTDAVGLEDARIGPRRVRLQPLEERGSDIEADLGERVDDPGDPPVGRVHAGRRHRAVALPLDALVPIVKWRGRGLGLHLVEPRILPRWLIKMPMDDDRAGGHAHSPSAPATLASTSGNRSSRTRTASANDWAPSSGRSGDPPGARAAINRSASCQSTPNPRSPYPPTTP